MVRATAPTCESGRNARVTASQPSRPRANRTTTPTASSTAPSRATVSSVSASPCPTTSVASVPVFSTETRRATTRQRPVPLAAGTVNG